MWLQVHRLDNAVRVSVKTQPHWLRARPDEQPHASPRGPALGAGVHDSVAAATGPDGGIAAGTAATSPVIRAESAGAEDAAPPVLGGAAVAGACLGTESGVALYL